MARGFDVLTVFGRLVGGNPAPIGEERRVFIGPLSGEDLKVVEALRPRLEMPLPIKSGFVADRFEGRGQRRCANPKLSVQPLDPVLVWVLTRQDRCSGRRAQGEGAEHVLDEDPLPREVVDVRSTRDLRQAAAVATWRWGFA